MHACGRPPEPQGSSQSCPGPPTPLCFPALEKQTGAGLSRTLELSESFPGQWGWPRTSARREVRGESPHPQEPCQESAGTAGLWARVWSRGKCGAQGLQAWHLDLSVREMGMAVTTQLALTDHLTAGEEGKAIYMCKLTVGRDMESLLGRRGRPVLPACVGQRPQAQLPGGPVVTALYGGTCRRPASRDPKGKLWIGLCCWTHLDRAIGYGRGC